MGFSNEIIMIVTAASLGFSVATGINITYFKKISAEAKIHDNSNIYQISNFWSSYSKIADIEQRSNNMLVESKSCVIVDDKKICITGIK